MPPLLIVDQFSKLQISRQLRFQLRNRNKGKCILCSAKAKAGYTRCPKHIRKSRDAMRKAKLEARAYEGKSGK